MRSERYLCIAGLILVLFCNSSWHLRTGKVGADPGEVFFRTARYNGYVPDSTKRVRKVENPVPAQEDDEYEAVVKQITDSVSWKPKTTTQSIQNTQILQNAQTEVPPGRLEEVEIPERVSYRGNQLWNVKFEENAEKAMLLRLRDKGDISVWGGNHTNVDIMVKNSSLTFVKDILQRKKLKYNVIMEDIQKAIDSENPQQYAEIQELSNRKAYRLTWRAYHRLEDIESYLSYLAQTYPAFCSLLRIGVSVERRPLNVLKISNGKPGNKAIWVDGGIHAREWISPATVTYIINYLAENYPDNISEPLKKLDWYFLPVANPDGYEYSHSVDRLWRKNRGAKGANCAGVDLNRNFGYKWGGKGTSRNPCTEIYGGPTPFSEPETGAIKRFIETPSISWKAYVSFHSYGQYILYPWGYDRFLPPDHHELQNVAMKAAMAMMSSSGTRYKVGPAAATLYPASGGSDDWAKGSKYIKYSYTIELRDSGRYGFVLPSSYIIPTAKEALLGLLEIATVAAGA